MNCGLKILGYRYFSNKFGNYMYCNFWVQIFLVRHDFLT